MVLPELVAIDIETTGLYPDQGDRICEIAFLRIRDDVVVEKLVTLVNPERELSFASSFINGITNEMVRDIAPFRQVVGEVGSFLEGATVLIHNAAFDLSFLKAQMRACGRVFPPTQVIDTLKLARKYFTFTSNSLGNLADYFKISKNQVHRAESDAWTAYRVFCVLYPRLLEQGLQFDDLTFPSRRIDVGLNPEEFLPPFIARSLGKKAWISVRYAGGNAGVEQVEMEPVEIVREGGVWLLIAVCRPSGTERRFLLDKIVEVMENIE